MLFGQMIVPRAVSVQWLPEINARVIVRLARLQRIANGWPFSQIEKLMPWNYIA